MTDEPQPDKKSDVELVREAREALKAENDALEGELRRKEELRSAAILGGRSVAVVEAPKIETAKEYADRVMSGKVEVKK